MPTIDPQVGTGTHALDRIRPGRLPWILFVAVALLHAFSGVKVIGDTAWSLPTAMSILAEGDTDLVEYADMIDPADYRLEWIDGRPYTRFPLGASLFALPAVALLDGTLRIARGESYARELRRGHGDVERVIASLLVALAAVVAYRSARRWPADRGVALAVALVLAFGTPAWSTASRALWSHAPALLMLACAAHLWLRGEDEPRFVPWIALPLALGFVCRPTMAVPAAVFTLLVAARHPRRLPAYLGVAALVAAPWLAFNLQTYDAWLPAYYRPARLLADGPRFGTALLGHLASPARGLFVYSPFVVLSVAGAVLAWRGRRHRGLAIAALSTTAGYWLVNASFRHWWGGHSYGPRFFADVMPLLVLMLPPLAPRIRAALAARRPLLPLVCGLLVAWSVGAHAVGAAVPGSQSWNRTPVDVDHAPGRLWDWSDPPFLRWRDPAVVHENARRTAASVARGGRPRGRAVGGRDGPRLRPAAARGRRPPARQPARSAAVAREPD